MSQFERFRSWRNDDEKFAIVSLVEEMGYIRKWIVCAIVSCGTFIVLLAVFSTGSKKSFLLSVQSPPTYETKYSESYVLAVKYTEQLTSGLRNSLQLGHLYKEINARIVEPFVKSSGLLGIPGVLCSQNDCNSKVTPLTTMLDYSKIAKECYDVAEPVSFETFLETSARQLVLLHPVWEVEHPYGGSLRGILSGSHETVLRNCIQTDSHVCECGGILKKFVTIVEATLNKNSNNMPHFSIRSVICFATAKPITLALLLQMTPSDSPLSYIFTLWFGTACRNQLPSLHPGNEQGEVLSSLGTGENTTYKVCTEAKRTHIIPKISLPNTCTRRSSIEDSFISVRFFSPLVNELATTFLRKQHLKDIKNMISIHYRTEWIYRLLSDSSKAINCCMKELNQLLASLSAEVNLQKNAVLISDRGPYGSRSCASSCSRLADSLLSALKKSHKLTPVYFDPVKYNCTSYANSIPPLVEHASLARGRYLVLIGGGKFQRSILTSALQVGNVKKVYSVCSSHTNSPEGLPSTVEYFSLNTCLNRDGDT